MTVTELYPVIVDRALIVLHRALVLQQDLFLVVEQLFWDSIARPRRAIAVQIHLRLRQHICVVLQCALGLHQLRLIGSRIDVDQRLSLANRLPFAKVNRSQNAAGLRNDGSGIDRSHRADRFKVNADVSLGDGRNRRTYGRLLSGQRQLGRRDLGVVPMDDKEDNPAKEQQKNQARPNDSPSAIPRMRRGQLVIRTNVVQARTVVDSRHAYPRSNALCGLRCPKNYGNSAGLYVFFCSLLKCLEKRQGQITREGKS